MARRSFSRTNRYERYIPFGLFGGQISGVVLLGLSLVLVLASALRPGWGEEPRLAIQNRIAPSLEVVSLPFFHLAEGVEYLFSLTRLKTEVQQLRAKNKHLEDWYNKAQLLQAENQSLRDLLKVKLEPGLAFTTARVIADLGGPYGQSLLVNVGTADDIQKGDAVMAGEGLIGRVMQAYENTSQVLLMTDINSRIPVRLDGSNVQAILVGSNGQHMGLARLPEGAVLRDGQSVLTSGIGGVFPPDLPVGRVLMLPDGRAALAPYANFGRLMYVRIIRMPRTPFDPPAKVSP